MYIRNKIVIAAIFIAILTTAKAGAQFPGDEKPTCKEIWIKIDNASFSMKEMDGKEKITIEVEGSASPGVDHCGIVFVTVYKNGSTDYRGVFIEGPLNITGRESIIFLPVNGSWEKWRFYHVAYVDKEKIGLREKDLKNISSFQIWARAYKDKEGTLWNQTNMTLTQVVKKEIEATFDAGKEKKKFIPSFSLPLLIAALSILAWKKFK